MKASFKYDRDQVCFKEEDALFSAARGAGKTSLLRGVTLLERLDRGRVVVAGINLTSLTTKALRDQRRRIGTIFQHVNLLGSATFYDNIALPLIINGASRIEI